MKKMIGYILLASMFVLQLGGCGREKDAEVSDISGTEGAEDAGMEISVEPGDILDPTAVSDLEGKDNFMDTYTAVMNVPLQVETPKNALGARGDKTFLGTSRAYRFIKHLLSSTSACWDELSFVTVEGETGSESFDWDHTVWSIGQVAGTDHYITLDFEEQEGGEDFRYFFTERDENREKQREFPLNFLGGGEPFYEIERVPDFAVDASGVAHLLWSSKDGPQYLLVSQEGEVLAECALKGNVTRKLVPLYDGRIALLSLTNGNDKSMALQHMDVATGSLEALAVWEKPENVPYYATLLDEETLLYADREGVYRSGLSGEKPELLYYWYNHGLITHGVSAMRADEEGRLLLIYEDSEDYKYLCLEPATEKQEICEITLAVPPLQMENYQWAAVEFNKRYPSCHIELTEYGYNDTALLTQLSAGKGPVLIDPFLMNFEELEKLWEPLDTVMEQLGITEELLPSVVEMGKINGKLYGMVTDFSLRTVVVSDPNLKDWDYDLFMQCAEDKPDLEALFNMYGGNYGFYFIRNFLSHGLEDNYFLDEETGRMVFDSSKFRKALELATKYCVRGESEEIRPGSSLLEGKVLCNTLNIYKPEHLALYRVCYGEDANYIGYPTKDGGAHLMSFSGMLSIRRSATKAEKEAAVAFISLYLSYEGQSHAAQALNFNLSVRNDVLEEQLASMNSMTLSGASGFEQIRLGNDVNIELDRKTLLDMLDTAKPEKSFPRELRDIMDEELDAYFSGDITEDMLISHLESRVGLYVEERK